MQNTFSCISLQLFCTTTTGFFQKLPSYTFYGENIVCVPVPDFFFAATHLHLGGLSLFSFSHRRQKIFMILFQRNWSPLFFFFISRPTSFFVIQVKVVIKIKPRKRKNLLCYQVVFISKSLGGYEIYLRNGRVLEMQNFTPAYMKEWTYARADFLRTKTDLTS